MIRATGLKFSWIALVGVSIVGCRSVDERPVTAQGVLDTEAAEKQAAMKRDKLVNALDSAPDGVGKSIDPR